MDDFLPIAPACFPQLCAKLIHSILVTFSSPFIASVNFLSLPAEGGTTTFGSFGWCSAGFCLPNRVGYE